ncbi:MAG: ferrochelatase [Gemmatimonadota bacterium]
MADIGVLVMAYGGPNRIEDVEPYLLDVRNFRPTSPAVVHEIRERYARIGGRSPILERTETQARALQSALDADDAHFRVVVGMRHWHPYIGTALKDLELRGIGRAVGLVMAPHYSRMSIGAYFQKITAAESAVTVAGIETWHLLDGLVEALTGRIRDALERFPVEVREKVTILFTAHSLPERILSWNDPYPSQLQATMDAVLARLGRQPARFAYQSAAMTPDPWLGPDARRVIAELAAAGARDIVIAPIGFTCEHVEILYDVDIEFQRDALALGVRLERIEMVNDAPPMMAGLAGLVRQKAEESGWL